MQSVAAVKLEEVEESEKWKFPKSAWEIIRDIQISSFKTYNIFFQGFLKYIQHCTTGLQLTSQILNFFSGIYASYLTGKRQTNVDRSEGV